MEHVLERGFMSVQDPTGKQLKIRINQTIVEEPHSVLG